MIWRLGQNQADFKRAYPFAIVAMLALAGIGWGLHNRSVSGDQTDAFLSAFEGQTCFLVRSVGSRPGVPIVEGVGADETAFRHFYDAFIRFVGIEPNLTVRLIAPSQCPAIALLARTAPEGVDAPRIKLESYEASIAKPLVGTVSNLAGRTLDLLLIGSDGQVRRFDIHAPAGGADAAFSVPVIRDAGANNALQIVLAIASDKPLQTLAGFREGAASEILPRLERELPAEGIGVEFFRYVD